MPNEKVKVKENLKKNPELLFSDEEGDGAVVVVCQMLELLLDTDRLAPRFEKESLGQWKREFSSCIFFTLASPWKLDEFTLTPDKGLLLLRNDSFVQDKAM